MEQHPPINDVLITWFFSFPVDIR